MSQRSDSIFLLFTEGRYVRAVRFIALALIVGTAFIGQPRPSLTGDGLVILVSLVVAAGTQVAITMVPSGSTRHEGPGGARRARVPAWRPVTTRRWAPGSC